ncbi:hypothetical protein NN3_58240 [Nocardia neocaledoniensis NBRC 108232]|uniref:DUF6194 domain-containing protein n=1 Tax=Nocardia neocaledoniensis TaxID=236511 RepID=A0A317NVL3_9NOCA|nr:DUF6194 family protein [Nocardia neocaledoniensis]PWV77858.1 hypothetical protein DFR69_103458 [Nocardia neocaledoniensis]GEM34817.1 hypothetical protein NN3_58240 [Nocardia neocaledoniensis NBRC 108232]
MTIDDILEFLGSLDGVLILRPEAGSDAPEISWGDAFCYYAPDGIVPTTVQPFATIVTKQYPDESDTGLDRPGAFRVNVAAGRDAFTAWTGHAPGRTPARPTADDTVLPHPTYGSAGWLAVVNPGERTATVIRELLTDAHARARARFQRRTS